MDRGQYEKLSIRDSARSLKKYGSTSSKSVTRNENFVKHFVSNTDTLQGIALKYNVTIAQIQRANRMWPSDSLFLKEFVLIPTEETVSGGSTPFSGTPVVSPTQDAAGSASNRSSIVSNASTFEEDNYTDYLSKIDASIAGIKKDVKKAENNSKFSSSMDCDNSDSRRKPAISRMKQLVNNNSGDSFNPPTTIVVQQQGKKVKTSIQHHEKQQDELFEL